MKILFLHGLESKLNEEKRQILEKFGEVNAPDLNYKNDGTIIKTMNDNYGSAKVDVIIGSSMGGFTGFYLASQLKVPALLFNPALPYRTVAQEEPEIKPEFNEPVFIVLGQFDPIIKYSDTQDFLRRENHVDNIKIILRHDLEHRIPTAIFEEEVSRFFAAVETDNATN